MITPIVFMEDSSAYASKEDRMSVFVYNRGGHGVASYHGDWQFLRNTPTFGVLTYWKIKPIIKTENEL